MKSNFGFFALKVNNLFYPFRRKKWKESRDGKRHRLTYMNIHIDAQVCCNCIIMHPHSHFNTVKGRQLSRYASDGANLLKLSWT